MYPTSVPIKAAAQSLNLKLHEINTFTGWTPPEINLIIAVSFGLKVPPRILDLAKYGGLNLHPSLLPELRGPAPLHHTLLQGRPSSGITLQTLHRDNFDEGTVLSQSAFDLPNHGECTFDELHHVAAQKSAHLLLDGLRRGLYKNGEHANQGRQHPSTQRMSTDRPLSYARKIVPEDMKVEWIVWPASRILRVQRALGNVWSLLKPHQGQETSKNEPLRFLWHDLRMLRQNTKEEAEMELGMPHLLHVRPDERDREQNEDAITREVVVLRTRDDRLLTPRTITVEGRPGYEDAVQVVKLLQQGKL